MSNVLLLLFALLQIALSMPSAACGRTGAIRGILSINTSIIVIVLQFAIAY